MHQVSQWGKRGRESDWVPNIAKTSVAHCFDNAVMLGNWMASWGAAWRFTVLILPDTSSNGSPWLFGQSHYKQLSQPLTLFHQVAVIGLYTVCSLGPCIATCHSEQWSASTIELTNNYVQSDSSRGVGREAWWSIRGQKPVIGLIEHWFPVNMVKWIAD